MKKWIVLGTLALLGAAVFWLPSVVIHRITKETFDGPDAIDLLAATGILHFSYIVLVCVIRKSPSDRAPFAFMTMLLIWLLGPVFMALGGTITDWGIVPLAMAVFPVFTFMISGYDGTLFNLVASSIVLLILGLWQAFRMPSRQSKPK